MKKLGVVIAMAIMAVAGHAQTVFNVRAGGGRYIYTEEYGDSHGSACAVIAFEANISVNRTSRFVISPSAIVSRIVHRGEVITVPLHFGYKIPFGKARLVPKVGPMATFVTSSSLREDSEAFGYSAELALEMKHFVVTANFQEDSFSNRGIFGTIGYRF